MLSQSQIGQYREQGYLLLEDVIPPGRLAELRRTIEYFVDQSRQLTGSNAEFDLDASHRPDAPRVRRLKDPHLRHQQFLDLSRDSCIVDPVSELLGGTVRFDHSKLNFKHPDARAEISWHQDWAFYPHTNDDMLAVGVMIEDCTPDNGPLMVIPGSHRGPVYDHHHDGLFAGGVDRALIADQLPDAVEITAPAGSISLHHVRTLHASRNSTSTATRPLLLFSYAAVDAFPVFEQVDLAEFDSRILRGQPVIQGRMEPVPIRLPYPRQPGADSIYDNQASMDTV